MDNKDIIHELEATLIDENKPNIIFIDDEVRILRSLRLIFRRSHNVYTTTDPNEFRQLIRQHDMDVIVCDQRMPKVTGTELLKESTAISPKSIRILLTGYADLSAVIDSINEGEIYRYITKPWDANQLREVIAQATMIAQSVKNLDVHKSISFKQKEKLTVLVMFENENIYNKFNLQFGEQYHILWAKDMDSAIHHVSSADISLVVTDVHFCNEEIIPVVNTLKELAPAIMVLAVTGYQDSQLLIKLINYGQIFRCLVRPISAEKLELNMQQASQKHLEVKNMPELAQRFTVEQTQDDIGLFTEQHDKEESVFSHLLGRIRHRFGS